MQITKLGSEFSLGHIPHGEQKQGKGQLCGCGLGSGTGGIWMDKGLFVSQPCQAKGRKMAGEVLGLLERLMKVVFRKMRLKK